MKREYKINIGLSLLVIAVVILVLMSRTIAGIVEGMISIVILAGVVGLSIYKLVLWFRYRNDPGKRETVVYSGRIYPEKIRRFLMDEKVDTEKK